MDNLADSMANRAVAPETVDPIAPSRAVPLSAFVHSINK